MNLNNLDILRSCSFTDRQNDILKSCMKESKNVRAFECGGLIFKGSRYYAGVEIPAEIAKRAYLALNGCLEGICKDLSIPVLNYTITETGKDYIKAGCHTIPKSDIKYISNLLGWH